MIKEYSPLNSLLIIFALLEFALFIFKQSTIVNIANIMSTPYGYPFLEGYPLHIVKPTIKVTDSIKSTLILILPLPLWSIKHIYYIISV